MACQEEPDAFPCDRIGLPDHRKRDDAMVGRRPAHWNAYEFVAVAALRAQQLLAGCTPRLEGEHSATVMAQMEVGAGCVVPTSDTSAPKQRLWQQ
jgi:DNA-directed RNA polymerase subunit K/omega